MSTTLDHKSTSSSSSSSTSKRKYSHENATDTTNTIGGLNDDRKDDANTDVHNGDMDERQLPWQSQSQSRPYFNRNRESSNKRPSSTRNHNEMNNSDENEND